MNRRDNDELRNIPTMKPARDEVVQRRQTPSRPPPSGSGGGKGFSFFLLLLVLASWAGLYLLWEQANTARSQLQDSEKRIASLESQLANTGDEMSQSDAAVRIRLKELDTEVRKLWDNVWKKSKAIWKKASAEKNVSSAMKSLLPPSRNSLPKSRLASPKQKSSWSP